MYLYNIYIYTLGFLDYINNRCWTATIIIVQTTISQGCQGWIVQLVDDVDINVYLHAQVAAGQLWALEGQWKP